MNKEEVFAALDRLENDALASRDGYGDARKNADIIRTALTRPPVNAALLEALNKLLELQDAALSLKVRAENIKAPEDTLIKELCERIGYGAVMDSAARQWYLKDNVGCHTTYTVRWDNE